MTSHGDPHETLLDQSKCPLIFDDKVASMALFDLPSAARSANTQPTTLPLAACSTQLDSTRLRIYAACPARTDPDPSLASDGLGLFGNDGRASLQNSRNHRRATVRRDTDRSDALTYVRIAACTPVAKSPDN
jgi:hypothetical protein